MNTFLMRDNKENGVLIEGHEGTQKEYTVNDPEEFHWKE